MASIASPSTLPEERAQREPVLSLVDRVSEALFGLLMALSFVGAVSVAESGQAEIREMFVAALGCNLAWGLVDAVMYLVRTITERGRALSLARAVRGKADDPPAGRELLERALSGGGAAQLLATDEIEAIRTRILALPDEGTRPKLNFRDLLAAVGIFLIVVAVTFPVVLPFAMLDDVGLAKNVSRGIALVMLFFGGMRLGGHAGYGSWKVGFMMAGLGTALVLAINALGG
jgi:hypothetical protein